MARIPIYNAASDIIQAFSLGAQERRQSEQDKLRQEQNERDYAEKVRQFNAGHALLKEQEESRRKAEESLENARKATEAHNKLESGLRIRAAIAAGTVKPNFREELQPGQNWAMNNPQTVKTPMDLTMEGVTVPGNEMVLPEEYIKTLTALDTAKSAGELGIAAERAKAAQELQNQREAQALLMQGNLFGQQADLLDKRLQSAERIAETRANAVEAKAGERADKADKRTVKSVIDSVKTDRLYKAYTTASDAFQWVNQPGYYNLNKNSPGARQIDLIYKYMRTQDDSVVKPSEFDVASKGAMSFAQQLGFKAKRIFDPSTPLLSPQAEEALRQQMVNRTRITMGEFEKLVHSKYNDINYLVPDHGLSPKQFRDMIYDTNVEEEGKRVKLVPKKVVK